MVLYPKASPVSGTGLFALQALTEGQTALVIERPLVTALDNKTLPDTCANCFQRAQKTELGTPRKTGDVVIKACTGCRTLRYCSKQCQSDSWKREHKHDCKLLGQLSTRGTLPNAARAVLRMLQLSKNDDDESPFRDLMSHRSTILEESGDRAENLMVLSTGIHNYSGTKLGIEFVQHCFALVFTNTLTLWTSTFDSVGIALDPLAALANHSCEPNAITVWDGSQLSFRTLRAIAKDEELFISYIDATNPYYRRRFELRSRYYFECKCVKCERGPNEWNDKFLQPLDPHEGQSGPSGKFTQTPTSIDYLGKGSEPLDYGTLQNMAFDQLEKAQKEDDPKTSYPLLLYGLDICGSTLNWPLFRQPLPSLVQETFFKLLAAGERIHGFVIGLHLHFYVNPKLYPQSFHPVRIIHTWALAMLALLLSAPEHFDSAKYLVEEGVDLGTVIVGFLNEIRDRVDQSHGADSSFARQALAKIDEVKSDMSRGDCNVVTGVENWVGEQMAILKRISGPNSKHIRKIYDLFRKTRDIQSMTA